MKERKEIDDKYKWDLSCYVKDENELINNLQNLKKNIPDFTKFYGKFNDKKTLLEYLKLEEDYDLLLSRTASYIYNTLEVDNSNTKFISYSQKLEYIYKEYSETTAYVYPQMLNLDDEYLNSLINDKTLYKYSRFFQEIKRDKAHKISEYDSQFLSKMSLFLNNEKRIFEDLINSEITFDKITDEKGNEYEVNEPVYSKFSTGADRELRKNVFLSLMKGYGGKIKTLSNLYTNSIQQDIFFAKLANFNSVKQQCMYNEEVDEIVYDILIKNINQRLDVFRKINKLKAKYLGIKDFAFYDKLAVKGMKKQYSIEEAIQLTKECTKPLGEEYQKLLNEKFNQKVIDYLPNKNKRSLCYSTSEFGCPSIVLINFEEDYNSVSALVHEIGHAIHDEFSNKYQPVQLANYVIFVAEVASTVNEILLNLYLLKKSSKEEKVELLFELLTQFSSAVYTQCLFSEFEDYAHSTLENGESLAYEDYNNKYYELNKKYYGEDMILPEELKFGWSKINHFYTPFYVYKYATGFISAVCIVQNILNDKEYYNKYIQFLKSGRTKSPIELLKDVDVDLTTNEPYIKAFKFIENTINSLTEII